MLLLVSLRRNASSEFHQSTSQHSWMALIQGVGAELHRTLVTHMKPSMSCPIFTDNCAPGTVQCDLIHVLSVLLVRGLAFCTLVFTLMRITHICLACLTIYTFSQLTVQQMVFTSGFGADRVCPSMTSRKASPKPITQHSIHSVAWM